MAQFTTNTNHTYYAILTITESSQSIAGNYTDLNYSVTLHVGNNSFSGYTIGYDVYINGVQVAYHTNSGNQTSMSANSSKLVVSGTTRVNHNSDGTKTNMPVSIRIFTNNMSYLPVELNGSGTMNLTTIPRYATVTQSLNTKTSSSIKINWSSDSTIDYIWYSKDNGSTWTGIDVTDGTSGNYTISSLAANTTYNIKTRVRRKDSQLTTDSTALSVKTYQTTIPTISLSSKTSTSITVTSSCNVTVSETKYRIKTSSGSYGAYQTSATFSNLTPNTAYVVEVYKVGTDSGESGTATLNVSTYQKTIPTISLSSKTSSSITVTSSCNVTVSSTQYRIKQGSGSYGSYQTSASFTGLAANTTYTIEVKKVGTTSGEAGTATLSVTTYYRTIPTISLSSKTVNSITVTSGCNVAVSSTQYRIKTSSGSYGGYQTSNSFTGLTPNTAYVVEVKKVGTASGEAGTATLNVSTYDIAKISNYPNFNLGDNETIQYSNPSGATIAIGVFTTDGGTAFAAYRTVSGSSYTFQFTDSELDTLYKAMSTSNTVLVRVYLRTTANNTNYYDYKSITITLTGNQKTGHVNVSSSWKRSKKWVNVNGTWKRCVRWVNVNGTWKRCI